ncbi:hypothetical protein LTSEHVI_3371 [Salmonella enterica subsp. enterica serovar Hvittingfoss str. A4-620]|nr:hypothetical protein LTSEHVI_3371 [Salmonella enterica subsp. enterica serovar Hvittingfoss str. A4-620]
MGVRKFDFEGRQFIGKCSAGRAQGVQVAFYIGFNPNCRTARLGPNPVMPHGNVPAKCHFEPET